MENPRTESARPHPTEGISWEADDFYYHPKNASWYILAILSSTLVAVIPWLISGKEDFISPAIILVALLGLTIYAGRKPQKKNFNLTNSRIKIDSQSFDLFSFSRYWVEVFDTHTQVTLVGIKRTAMPISLCIKDKELTKKVLDILQTSLPETNPSRNPADWLMRKVKF